MARSRSGARTIRDPGHRVNAGDAIAVAVPAARACRAAKRSAFRSTSSTRTTAIIVIDKPAGLVVHPAAGHATGTLVNALIAHCGDSLSGIGGVKRPGIVHRLDKDTSGLLVVAKTDQAHQALAAQFADHGRTGPLRRGYLALRLGRARPPERHHRRADRPPPQSRDKMAVRADGRAAITHWQVLERYPGTDGKPVASLIACRLETGRTHQIRVHLAHIGHPLLGDAVYGTGFKTKAPGCPRRPARRWGLLDRQALHAYLLAVQHPISGEMLEFRSELPADLARLHHSLKP